MTRSVVLSSLFVSMLACGGATPPSPIAEPPARAPAPAPATAAAPKNEGAGAGAPLTAEACRSAGGHVVGDIGDGAIHRPGYRCSDSGAAPLGKIAAPASGPIAIEGSVCCK